MRYDKFTIKAQEAIQGAHDHANRAECPEIGAEHLLSALLDQADGVVTPILQKVGADVQCYSFRFGSSEIQKGPKVHGRWAGTSYFNEA